MPGSDWPLDGSSLLAPVAAFPTEETFRVVAESLPYIVWIAEPNGDTVYFNRQGCAYTGHPPEANYGWNWVSLVHPGDAEHAHAGWEEATRSGRPYELTYRIRRYDGTFRLHGFRALPVHVPDGGIVKWIGIAVDIDEPTCPDGPLGRAGIVSAPALTASPVRNGTGTPGPQDPLSRATAFLHDSVRTLQDSLSSADAERRGLKTL
jgi:PAS domain S-box-containing protein